MKKMLFTLLILGVVFLIFGFIVSGPSVDIPIHDTYFVIGLFQFTIPAGIMFLLWAFVYWILLNFRRLKKWLIWLHLWVSLIIALLFVCTPLFLIGVYQGPQPYESSIKSLNDINNSSITILLIIFLGLQVIPFINFFISNKR